MTHLICKGHTRAREYLLRPLPRDRRNSSIKAEPHLNFLQSTSTSTRIVSPPLPFEDGSSLHLRPKVRVNRQPVLLNAGPKGNASAMHLAMSLLASGATP